MKKLFSQTPYIRIENRFFNGAQKLRAHFDQQFKNPLEVHEGRFVWDYWNVPNHYCHLRTPAYHYFPESDYEVFHTQLVEWGRENLGCHDISPTWLSCYPEGSFQNVHVDEPHGPLAFVFSLTKSLSQFKGGETIISPSKKMKGLSAKNKELSISPLKVFKKPISIASKFNRLIVFDPSFPHGVSETQGTKDPRHSRLVIHGWFIQPRPFWTGELSADEVQEQIDLMIDQISGLKSLVKCEGYIGLRIQISKLGMCTGGQVLVSTLNSLKAQTELLKLAQRIQFKPKAVASELTIPLVFNT